MTVRLFIATLLAITTAFRANAAEVVLNVNNSGGLVQIYGDKDREWWLESSPDLSSWTRVENFPPLLSSGHEPSSPLHRPAPGRAFVFSSAGNGRPL